MNDPAIVPRDTCPYYHHIGLYAYQAQFLKEYVSWGPCPMEQAERLEQLRVLWHGYDIMVGVAIEAPLTDINTKADFEAALKRLNSND